MTNGYPQLTRVGQLIIQTYERYIPSAFDESMSILQKLNRVEELVNQTGILVNSAVDVIEAAIVAQDLDIVTLQQEAIDYRASISLQQNDFETDITDNLLPSNIDILLSEWFDNGRLQTIINNSIYEEIDVRYTDAIFQLGEKTSIVKTGFISNFIKKCLDGSANGAWLGDSITVGGGTTPETTFGYAYQLTNKLQTKYGNGVTMDNRGHGGYRTSRLLDEIVPVEILPYNYDFINVACGTNDWNYSVSLLKFETDYRNLIETLITKTNADILCFSIGWFENWVSPTANTINEVEYNKIIKRICAEYKIGYVDVYSAMKDSGYTFDEMTYPPDRVHPNNLGATLWANEGFTWFDYQGFMTETEMSKFEINRIGSVQADIVFSTGWTTEGPYASTYNLQTRSSSTTGSKATFDYVGEKIKVYFVHDLDRGKVKITLDGVVLYAEYDTYSETFNFTPLTFDTVLGSHKLEIEILGTKNVLSTSVKVSLGLIDMYVDLNKPRTFNEVSHVLPDNLSASPARSVDVNALYYFGKGVGAGATSDTVLGMVYTKPYCSKFKILYTKFLSYGIFDVYVDGVKKGTIDTYASVVSRQNVFEVTGLTLDSHLIELKTTGTKNPSSTGYGMVIEGLLCYNTVKTVRNSGTHNIPISYQFYEAPNIQVTPTSNCTAYVSNKTEKSVTVQTTPVGGTFDIRAEGY